MANFNIAYLIELRDKYTKVAEKICRDNKTMRETFDRVRNSVYRCNEILERAKGGFNTFGTKMKGIGSQVSGLGKSLAGASATIGGLFWKSLRSWEAQNAAIGALDNALKNRTTSLGYTSQQIQDMATSMQKKSIFGDEAIIQNVSNQLVRFDKVNGDIFKRANQAVLDMTSGIKGANATAEMMQPMALLLGKALQTPAEALNSLGRAGVKFTKDEADVIKYLVETGNQAKAQEYILSTLESKYKGASEALGNTQPLKQLANAFDDMLEPLGQIVQEFLVPLVKGAGVLIEKFNSLNKPIKTVIVSLLGIVAIASPLLMVVGGVIEAIGTVSTGIASFIGIMQKWNIIAKISAGVQWVLNSAILACPITWIIAGIIALIAVIVIAYKKCTWFRETVQILWGWIKVGWTYVQILGAKIKNWFIDMFDKAREAVSNVWNNLIAFKDKIVETYTSVRDSLGPFGKFAETVFLWTNPLGMAINFVKNLIGVIQNVVGWIDKAREAFAKWRKEQPEKIADAQQQANEMLEAERKKNAGKKDNKKEGKGKQEQIKSEQAKNNSGTFDASIKVTTDKGVEVTDTKVKSTGNVKPKTNLGNNRAKR